MKLTLALPAVVVRARPAAVALLLAAVALTGCEKPPPPVALRIGVIQTQGFLPYYVMQEQGFDKKYGLRFEETPYSGGPAAINAMVAGALALADRQDLSPLAFMGFSPPAA